MTRSVTAIASHPQFKRKAVTNAAPKRPYRLEVGHGTFTITLHTAYSSPTNAIRGAAERLARGGTSFYLFDAVSRALLAEGTREGHNIFIREGQSLARTITRDAPLSWHRVDRSTQAVTTPARKQQKGGS